MSGFQAWTTADEIKWLNKIGETTASTSPIPKRKMLEGYLEGLRKRYYTPTLVREEIEAHAKQLLLNLHRKPT